MRYYGRIGFETTIEERPSVFVPTIVERFYKGDVYHLSSSRRQSSGVNDDLTFSQEISIVADPYAMAHYSQIAYVTLDGARWKVVEVAVERPRLRLSLGDVWHGEQTEGVGPSSPGHSYGM